MKMWWIRLMNRLGFRSDTMMCINKELQWCWPPHLGRRTEGECATCGGAIYYEKQNKPFRKVCYRCSHAA